MRHRLLPCLFVGLLAVTSAPVYAQDAGLDAGPDAGLDAGLDAGADAGPDVGLDAGVDAGVDAGPDAGAVTDGGTTTDGGADAGAGADAALAFRFSGTVDLQGSDAASGEQALVTLTAEDGTRFREFTDADGAFAVDELSPGTYEVEVEALGYLPVTDTVELDRDRRRDYTLFLDEFVPVALTIAFGGDAPLPDEVTVVFRSEREIFDVAIEAPEQGRELLYLLEGETAPGVGDWQITAGAEGFREVSYGLRLAPGASTGQVPVAVTLRLPAPTEAEVRREGGCAVAPGGRELGGALVGLIGLAGWMLARRRRRRAE